MEIWHRFDEAEGILAEWLDTLVEIPYAIFLSDSHDEVRPETAADQRIDWTLYRSVLDSGRIQLVVQGYRPGKKFLGLRFAQVLAKGIWIDPDGTVVAMPEESLYEYM